MTKRTIGRYEIQEELGRGGMATVFRAFDPHFERGVAIKLLPQEFLHDPNFRTRFEREAKAIAALEHSAIVPVYDFGDESGQPYLVMRYMTGGSLSERLSEGPLSLEDVQAIVHRLASALEEAHAQGMIHRDLKPGNILFDKRGDAFLSDFGIVKLTEETATLTGSGIIGTPAYMSPEQVLGEVELDQRSDVYALGILIFEMLTGELPYKADTPIGLAFKHVNEPVPRILDIDPSFPGQLNDLLQQALAKDREDRIRQAVELADELTDIHLGVEASEISPPHLESQPRALDPTLQAETRQESLTEETPAGTTRVLRPSFKKHISRAGWILGLLAVTVVIAILATQDWSMLDPQSSPTPTQIVQATSVSLVESPESATDTPVVTLTPPPSAVPSATSMPSSSFVPLVQVATLDNLGHYHNLAWSPDGSQFVIGTGNRMVTLWSVEGWSLEQVLEGHGGTVRDVAWSPDGSFVASASGDGTVRIWETATWSVYRILTLPNPIESDPALDHVAWSPDGSIVATNSPFGQLSFFDVESGQFIRSVPNIWGNISWSPDGSLWASNGGFGRELVVWDASTWERVREFDDPTEFLDSLVWSSDGSMLWHGTYFGPTVHLWNVDNGRLERRFSTLTGCKAWSPDQSLLASGGLYGSIYINDSTSGERLQSIDVVESERCYLTWSPNGQYLVWLGTNTPIKIWERPSD